MSAVRCVEISRIFKQGDLEVVGQASDGKEALDIVSKLTPDIVLTDIEMPGMSGLDLASRLKEGGSPVKVMILTTFARPGYLRRALEAGGRGYMLKDAPAEKLAEAIGPGLFDFVYDPKVTGYVLRSTDGNNSERVRQGFEKGRVSPVADSVWVLEKHMCIKMSLSVSTPPVTTISLRPVINSRVARWMALKELAQAASTTQLVPRKSRRLLILPATTLPRRPGNEFSCQGMKESEIF